MIGPGRLELVSERPDGRGLSVGVTLPKGSVDNNGKVVADGNGVVSHGRAKVALTGTLVKGTYQLDEVIDANGSATEAAHVVTLK